MSYLKNNYHWLLFIIVIFGSIGAVVFTQQRADTGAERCYCQTASLPVKRKIADIGTVTIGIELPPWETPVDTQQK